MFLHWCNTVWVPPIKVQILISYSEIHFLYTCMEQHARMNKCKHMHCTVVSSTFCWGKMQFSHNKHYLHHYKNVLVHSHVHRIKQNLLKLLKNNNFVTTSFWKYFVHKLFPLCRVCGKHTNLWIEMFFFWQTKNNCLH